MFYILVFFDKYGAFVIISDKHTYLPNDFIFSFSVGQPETPVLGGSDSETPALVYINYTIVF